MRILRGFMLTLAGVGKPFGGRTLFSEVSLQLNRGDHLYVPVMNGTVYVIKWNAAKLDASAVVAINDLGMVGKS